MSFPFIDEVIAKFDTRSDKYWQHEIAIALCALRVLSTLSEEEKRVLEIEIDAWELRPGGGKPSDWGTYYHPFRLGNREDGSTIYRPDISDLGGDAITLWSKRRQSVTSPLLKARYADLLWDFSHVIQPGTKRDFRAGQDAVDAYVDQASAIDQISDIEAAIALERAFQIAVELNDTERIDLVADRLLLLGRLAPLQAIGVCSMPIRCLFGSRKVRALRHDQLSLELERRLEEAAQAVNGHACDVAANSLSKSYRSEGDRTKRIRVLRTLADTWEKQAEKADAGVAIQWLSSVVQRLEGEGLNEDADRLRLIMERRGPEALASMKTMSVETSIDRQEVDESIEKLIAVKDPFLALFRLARNLSPRCESLRLQVVEHERDFIFYTLFPRTIIGYDGLPKATIGSSDTDMDGRMVEEATQSLILAPSFFRLGYAKTKERFDFTPQSLAERVSASYLCSTEMAKPLSEGLQAYDEEDYTKAISVLIPQIEAMLRELLRVLEIPIRKGNRRQSGFSELKNMNDVLADQRVIEAMEEDLLFFLRIVFIDKRGWNLRNEFAHGALPAEAFNQGTASTVLMALLTLAMIGPHGFYFLSEAIEQEQKKAEITADKPENLPAGAVGD